MAFLSRAHVLCRDYDRVRDLVLFRGPDPCRLAVQVHGAASPEMSSDGRDSCAYFERYLLYVELEYKRRMNRINY